VRARTRRRQKWSVATGNSISPTLLSSSSSDPRPCSSRRRAGGWPAIALAYLTRTRGRLKTGAAKPAPRRRLRSRFVNNKTIILSYFLVPVHRDYVMHFDAAAVIVVSTIYRNSLHVYYAYLYQSASIRYTLTPISI